MLSRFSLPALLLVAVSLRAATEAPPKLTVVISVDQMRGDYFARFGPHFGEGGFKRLLRDGVQFSDAHYRHAITHTSAGHATILTGAHPMTHTVVSNDWVEPKTLESVNCIEDREAPLVGIHPAELGPAQAANPAKTGRSPRNLAAETLGEGLKRRHGKEAKVIGVANKDRAAVLMAGRGADACYWDENGIFVTSNYYRPALPAWVQAFNAEGRAKAAFGATWDRLLPKEVYEKVQGADDQPGEGEDAGLGRTFPRKITGGADAVGLKFYLAFDNSPFTTEQLGEFAARAMREEQLGRDAVPDLLVVGFSQIDAIGHNFGPDSHEVMDSVLRLDRVLAKFFEALDREVGLANCLIVLTADHGVSPTPERIKADNPTAVAGRVKTAELDAVVKGALDKAFGPLAGREQWMMRDVMSYHLRPAALAAKNVSAADAARVVKEALARHPAMAGVWTREELLAEKPDESDSSFLAMTRRSYPAVRGRDVVYVFKPNFLTRTSTGTGHGTPHAYDTHVALVLAGPKVPKGVRAERVGIDQLAPTLAALIGIEAPKDAKARPLF